jgi:hypothetical protein
MANHPQRYYGTKELHFITCSCYHRQAWLASPQRRDLFPVVFEEVRQRYGFGFFARGGCVRHPERRTFIRKMSLIAPPPPFRPDLQLRPPTSQL